MKKSGNQKKSRKTEKKGNKRKNSKKIKEPFKRANINIIRVPERETRKRKWNGENHQMHKTRKYPQS